ncbi:MAG: patatin-like phospholipase family protein [Candidatus Helarchaeota archaeon]|nr:patatin-like phospholipase family protein [Candidatus Helarchaeota archaeon]
MLFILLLFLIVVPIYGEETKVLTLSYENTKNVQIENLPIKRIFTPKVGLALSGGGARGFAHIGVLKAFEDYKIPIDYIAGTSIGSVIGGLYAVGYTTSELEELAKKIEWNKLYFDQPKRRDLFLGQKQDITSSLFHIRFDGFKPHIPKALSAGQKLSSILNDLVINSCYNIYKDFDKFKISFKSVATNFLTGEKEIIDKGDLSQAMLASVAIPLLFSPVEIDGNLLVEGGLVNNIPSDILKDMGSEIIITINTVSPLRKREELFLPWEQADQVIGIMQRPINESSLNISDIVIQPELGDMLATNFNNIENVVNVGYYAALSKIDEIKRQLSKNSKKASNNKIFLEKINIKGLNHRNLETIRPLIEIKKGEIISENKIIENLKEIYNSGYFSDVKASISPSSDIAEVTFLLEENPIIKKIIIDGNKAISDEEILSALKNREGNIFNSIFWKDDYHNLIKLYRKNDFSLANINHVKFDKSNGTLTINIDEGFISAIEIKGNHKTRRHVILREFPLKAGEIFNLEKATQGITNIFSTGLFERVFLSVAQGNPHPKVTINIIEKKYSIVKIGARYDLEKSTRGLFELKYDNTFGIGAKTIMQLKYGLRDQLILLKLRADRIFKTYLTYDFSFYYKNNRNFLRFISGIHGTYTDTRRGGIFYIGQQMEKFGTVTFEFRMENLDILTYPFPQYNESLDLRTFTLRSVVDTQDKYPFPDKGSLYHLYYQRAAKILGGKISYTKIFFSFESYQTIKDKFTIHPSFVLGIADESLPFSERFRLGGDKSLFGIKENELHGRTQISGSIEYRMKIPIPNFFNTYINTRYDLGGIFSKNQKIVFKDFRHGIGGGLAIDIPFIPIEVSYGHISDGEDRMYVSVGHRF